MNKRNEKILVKYNEIALKGKNKYEFENQLVENIKKSFAYFNVRFKKIEKKHFRIMIISDDEIEKIENALMHVLGIKYLSFITEIERDIEDLKEVAKEIMEEYKKNGVTTISLKTKRSDKNFKYTSVDINKILGDLAKEIGIGIDYKNSKDVIYTEITGKDFLVYSKRVECFGGLPVGSEGKAIALLSGGIDSPVAIWNVMRRGCHVDFIHFHALKDNETVKNSKMIELAKKVNSYQFGAKLHIVPYHHFDIKTMGKIYPRYETIFFKYFIMQYAQKLAKEEGYDAIITGDSMAQVASQTLKNLKLSELNNDVLILRPLITYEKQEIIDLAEKIGTFDISVQSYRDCCSLFVKNPITQGKKEKFDLCFDKIDLNEIIEETKKLEEVIEL